MSEIFGGSGKGMKSGATGNAPPGGLNSTTTAGSQTHEIEFDNETGEMNIVLAEHLREYQRELMQAVYEEYYLANPDMAGLQGISQYIDDWLKKKMSNT